MRFPDFYYSALYDSEKNLDVRKNFLRPRESVPNGHIMMPPGDRRGAGRPQRGRMGEDRARRRRRRLTQAGASGST
jgi:hypothetical protein